MKDNVFKYVEKNYVLSSDGKTLRIFDKLANALISRLEYLHQLKNIFGDKIIDNINVFTYFEDKADEIRNEINDLLQNSEIDFRGTIGYWALFLNKRETTSEYVINHFKDRYDAILIHFLYAQWLKSKIENKCEEIIENKQL